ncbi:hypothetical protein [Amycolatopsis rubida]
MLGNEIHGWSAAVETLSGENPLLRRCQRRSAARTAHPVRHRIA